MWNHVGYLVDNREFMCCFGCDSSYDAGMTWALITNIILFTALFMLAILGILGLTQWISRKSLKKVDPELTLALIPLVLMTIAYFIFDKLIVLNVRPDGSGEPSFPSTHVMVVTTIFILSALVLPKYVKSKVAYVSFDIIMFAMIILVCVGRVLANMHWVSDVIGGLVFAAIFSVVYYLILKRRNNAKRIHKNH